MHYEWSCKISSKIFIAINVKHNSLYSKALHRQYENTSKTAANALTHGKRRSETLAEALTCLTGRYKT